jgi:hypothetical protein
MPSIAHLDPRLKECYKGARTPKCPPYGLGYIEQCDSVIPKSRFSNNLPKNMKKPVIEEMMRYFTVMTRCPKGQFPEAWIKNMTNCDLFTNPEAEEFHTCTPSNKKEDLAFRWKEYMNKKNTWISFYEWKKSEQKKSVQVTGEGSSTPGHKWKSTDGNTLESKTPFPPFQGILLENDSQQARATPLLIDTGNQLSGIDKRVQNVSEKINWTNIAWRGMATQVFERKEQVKPEKILDLQVSTNTIVHPVNQVHDRVHHLDSKVDHLLETIKEK